jgi:metal-dependent amidase/aminoacylase/carboxypeptidase family protein
MKLRRKSGHPDYACPDDSTSLLAGMDEMRQSLSGIVNQVRESSESISAGKWCGGGAT